MKNRIANYIEKGFSIMVIPNFILMLIPNLYFEMVESKIVSNWTVKYCLIPILIVTIVCYSFVYFVGKQNTKENASSFVLRLKAIGEFILYVLLITVFFFIGIESLILLTNAIGGGETVYIDGIITYSKSGKIYNTIEIQDLRLKSYILLDVKGEYLLGDTFTMEMKHGNWGVLYK